MNDEKMRVLLVRPMEEPEVVEIEKSLEAMQGLVGGWIEALYPYNDNVGLVCNEEGKLMGLTPNRMLLNEYGNPYDVICGDFFVAGLTEDDFCSLTDAQIERYKEEFSYGTILFMDNEKHQGSIGNYSVEECPFDLDR